MLCCHLSLHSLLSLCLGPKGGGLGDLRLPDSFLTTLFRKHLLSISNLFHLFADPAVYR